MFMCHFVHRLRMAQEIQRKLEETEVKQRELESRGVSVEKALRGEGGMMALIFDESFI
jgi:Zn-finger protein